MNEQEEQDVSDGGVGFRLMEARLLARRGRFAEATTRLAEAFSLGECTEVEALDLKARICAQQGLLLQAEVCWRKAQSLDADNPVYADALTALRQRQLPFATGRRLAVPAGIAALMLLLIGTLAAGHRLTQRLKAMEVMIGELRAPVDRTAEAITMATAALSKVTDADVTSRQTIEDTQQAIGDLRHEMDRSFNSICVAINGRLAEAKRQHETLEAKLGVADARQKTRDETLDSELQKTRESITALESAQTEKEQIPMQTNEWNRVWKQ